MAFLKAKLILIIVAVVGLASVGGAVLAVYQGADTEQKMKDITGLVSNVQRLQNDAVNSQVIEAKKDERAKLKTEFDRTMSTVLSMQKDNVFYEEVDKDGTVRRQSRKLLIDGVLPDAKDAKRIQFRDAYKREFEKLAQKLHGRPGPTDKEIEQEARNASIGKTPTGEGPPADIWQPRSAPPADEPKKTIEKEMQLPDLLKQWPIYRAADTVARQLWVYVDDNAFGRHVLATKEDITPTLVDIWQAQMSLWIQQDIATALARCNEERAEQLRKQGVAEPYWVAQMPVKRLEGLSIASYLGKGGGSGPKTPDGFALSWTGEQNDDKLFVVPMQVQMIVEEASVMKVIEKLCCIGFYTPTRINIKAVDFDPTFEEKSKAYIYGDEPVVEVIVDLEGYYFEQVFEGWIPKEVKQALKTPGAKDDSERG